MFDANCLNSILDEMSKTEGTGIRSWREFVARRTPLSNNNDSLFPAGTYDPSGVKLRI